MDKAQINNNNEGPVDEVENDQHFLLNYQITMKNVRMIII